MADLTAWVFHSPRRFVAVLVAVLAVVVGVGVAAQQVLGSRGGDRTSSAAGVVTDSGPATDAAVGFVRLWAAKPAQQSAEQWRAQLADRVTPELSRGLAQTDPATLPGGAPTGQPSLRFASVSSALVEVSLDSGPHVLVTVVQVGGHWLVSDIQPKTGDVGDVTPSAG